MPLAHDDYKIRENMRHIDVAVPSNGRSKARRKVGRALKEMSDRESFVEFWKRAHGIHSSDL
jgi:hypothetical protein